MHLGSMAIGVGNAAQRAGEWLRKVQTGNASFYLFAMMVGMIVFLFLMLFTL